MAGRVDSLYFFLVGLTLFFSALIAGLIVVAAIAVITSVGNKVLAKWQAVDTGLN